MDEPLILAISGEYNLDDAAQLEQVRTILQDLALNAEVEEASGFDPNGLGDAPSADPSHRGSTTSKGWKNGDRGKTTSPALLTQQSETGQSDTQPSQLSSLTSPFEDDDDVSIPRIDAFDGADDAEKISWLTFMFSDISQERAKEVLKAVAGDFQAVVDELMNQGDTSEANERTKGEASGRDALFKLDDEDPPLRKNKGKKRKGKGKGKNTPPSEQEGQGQNARCADEILFIVDRLNVTFDEVSDPYYRNHCSQARTVLEVLDTFLAQGVTAQDANSNSKVQELGKRYKRVPAKYLSVALQLAPIPEFGDDIAKLLEKHFSKPPAERRLDIHYNLVPPEDLVEGTSTPPSMPAPAAASKRPSSFADAARMAASLEEQRAIASASAAAAARRAKSDRLYGQAAVYYAEQAREHARNLQHANSLVADRLVTERRTDDMIDLHGVTVKDGVRIALREVRAWYGRLGEFKVREAKRRGFTVVTGLGRHSSRAGVSPLRQAVCRELVNDGWMVEVQTGKFVVLGRR